MIWNPETDMSDESKDIDDANDGYSLTFFERLIAPLHPEQFMKYFWCKRALFIKNMKKGQVERHAYISREYLNFNV